MALCFFSSSLFSYDVNSLSLEEKVGQLLMVHFDGKEANKDAEVLICDLHIGSIIYYNWSNGLTSPKQVELLSLGLQDLAKQTKAQIPLFIAIDQEGGMVQRLNQGFTSFLGNRALAMTSRPYLAYKSALAMGEEMHAVGINMNLAPVVDICSNPRSAISIRSFSEKPEEVSQFAREMIDGFQQTKVINCIKHFPGYGESSQDAHDDLPILMKSKEELFAHELIPYRDLAKKADCVMVGHMMVPALDPNHPATLSKIICEDLLRNEIGFSGVLIADSLVMEGFMQSVASIEEGAIECFNAGSDLLILGGKKLIGKSLKEELKVEDIKRIYFALIEATKSGRISEKRLNQSVERILKLKEHYRLDQSCFYDENQLNQMIATIDREELMKQIASLSCHKLYGSKIDFSNKRTLMVAPLLLCPTLGKINLTTALEKNKLCFFSINPKESEIQSCLDLAADSDAIIIFSLNAWKYAQQLSLIQKLASVKKPTVIIALAEPYDVTVLPAVDEVLLTYSPALASVECALNGI